MAEPNKYCSYNGKVRHKSPEDCLEALRRLGNKGKGELYLCAHCHSWHVTKAVQRRTKALNKKLKMEKERAINDN